MNILFRLLQVIVGKAYAQDAWGIYCDALGTACGDGNLYVAHIAVRMINAVIYPLVGGIAVIAVLWASIKMTASFGNDQGKEDAKKIIGYAVIGIVFSMTGYEVVKWICELIQMSTGGLGYCVYKL